MLVWLGFSAVAAFVVALAAGWGAVLPAPIFGSPVGADGAADALLSPAAAFHLAFALGALPLIFGAIAHFVPVLTRSRKPEALIHFLPLAVQAAGLLVPLGLMGSLPPWSLHLAAGLDATAALLLLFWVTRRIRQSLDTPHPGAHWYGAVLLCLFLAVSLVPVWLAIPELRMALRLFHLHLNTLGFIGLAALGTLPVLLPTALQRPDPTATARLHADLVWALTGALLIAAGAAAGYWLAVPGGLLLGGVIVRNLFAWWLAYRWKVFSPAGGPLTAATMGLLLLVVFGVGHGAGWLSARTTLSAYLVIFLLPLVTGALAQLLPVWRHPGADSPVRQAMQRRLVRGGLARAGLFFVSGIALLGEVSFAAVLAGLALIDFVLRLFTAFYNPRHS